MLVVVSLTTLAVVYIQSESFATLAKQNIQSRVSRDFGLMLNFDRLRIGVLPPSLSLKNVDVHVLSENNPLGLSAKTVFKAESLGFSFRMIQAFSGGIAINKVFLDDAEVQLDLPKSKGGTSSEKLSELVHRPIKVQLGDGFFLNIRQLELRNTMVDLGFSDGGQMSRLFIKKVAYLAVTPSSDGTDVVANLEEMKLVTPKFKDSLKTLKVNADIRKNLILVSTLDVQRKDAVLHAAGKFVGSIDQPHELRSDMDFILRGPLTELADYEKKFSSFEGDVLADMKMVGRLQNPGLQGKISLSGFRYSMWGIDKLEAVGSYDAGLAILDSLELQAGAGRLFLKNKLELPIPFKPESKTFQLKFDALKFQDVAGDLKKDVNNIMFQTDGTLAVRLDFAQAGEKTKLSMFTLKPDLSIKSFELNNQTFNKKRPYKKIFSLTPFHLNGNVQWHQGELKVYDSKLAFATGAVDVRGTVTDAGFDLFGSSDQIDMGKEVGDISGLPVTGDGSVRIHTHGPASAVLIDFDLRQKNAKFANFDFGEINGRVTYDDKANLLLIPDLKGQKNATHYAVEGKVNLGEGDDLNLSANFEDGDPNDLFAIFAHQLRDISWLPRGMGGTVGAKVKVGGAYTDGLATLDIRAQVRGKNLSYKGEIIHDFEAEAGVIKNIIYAKNMRAMKYETPIRGELEYNMNGDMRYQLDVERGKLRNLDFLPAAGIPVDGIFRFHSEGKGKWETLKSSSQFDVTNAFARTKPLPPVTMKYLTEGGGSSLQVNLGQDISFSSRMSPNPQGESTADFKLSEADFDYLLCILSRANCSDPSLALRARGEAHFTWKGSDWRALSGSGELKELSLSKTGFYLRSPGPTQITAQNGRLDTKPISLEGENSKLQVQLSGKVDGTALDNRIKGIASMKLLEFVTPVIEEARGKMDIDLSLQGDSANSRLIGMISLQDGFFRFTGLDAPAEGVNGKIKFNNNRVTLESMAGQLGGGSLQLSGGLNLYLNRAPQFDLDLFLANNRVKFYPVSFAEIADAKISFTGDHPPYLMGGTAHMKRVMMRNNFTVGSQKGLKNARYLPDKMEGSHALYEMKIRAMADGGIFVENDLLNAEFKGEVTLTNTFEYPQIVMRADLVRGKLIFRNASFVLDHASIRNPNPEIFLPTFSIGGTTNVENYRINIFASGNTEKPKINLSSNPSIPQEDIVSLLAFGYRGEDARKLTTADTNNIAYSEVGSILLDQLQLNQNLQSKGLRVLVVPSLTDTEENIIRPHTAMGQASPKVYVQTQILRNLDASFGGTVGATQGQSVDSRLEYRLSRKASVSAVYEQSPGLDATEIKNSFGGDLKFRWVFR